MKAYIMPIEAIKLCIKANEDFLKDNPKCLITDYVNGKITAFKRVINE